MSSYPVSDFYIFCTISIWEFIRTLDEPMVRKLSIRSFRRGTGSMDYIYGFLKMEDDLDMDDGGPSAVSHDTPAEQTSIKVSNPEPGCCGSTTLIPWWGLCQTMPQEVENKCCGQQQCGTTHTPLTK